MKDIKQIEKLISEINSSAEKLRKKKIIVKDEDLPSNLKLMLTGVTDSKAINFLFSSRVDVLLDKLLTLAMSGELLANIEKFITNEEDIKKLFDSFGFGEGSFEGPVSKTILNTVRDSMESEKYMKLSSDAKKVKYIYQKLTMKWWSFWNKPDLRKKYEQALYAIEKILRIIANVYENRIKIVNGFNNIIKEEKSSEDNKLVKII
jgi:hypothetical protein